MSSGIKYHAVLVKNGEIELITPVTTLDNARETVEYWKKNRPIFNESFYYSKASKDWAEKIEKYWKEYEESHKDDVDIRNECGEVFGAQCQARDCEECEEGIALMELYNCQKFHELRRKENSHYYN